MSLTRILLVGSVLGWSIGAIGYDVEIIVRGSATRWNYLLGISGLVGLLAALWYIRQQKRLKREKEKEI